MEVYRFVHHWVSNRMILVTAVYFLKYIIWPNKMVMPFPCVDDARNLHYRIHLNLYIHNRSYIYVDLWNLHHSKKFIDLMFPLIRVYIEPIIFVLNTYQAHETNIWTNMTCITLYNRSEQESTLMYKAATNAIKEIFFILSTFHPLHIVEDKWRCKCHWSYIITSI